MKVGIGYCNDRNAFLSGKTVAENAMRSQHLNRADLVLAFCGGGVDCHGFFAGLQSVVGNKTSIIGGSAVGVITNGDLSYSGWPMAAAVIQADTLRSRIVAVGDLDKSEELAGNRLAESLSDEMKAKLFLLFYDSVKIPPANGAPPVLNTSSLLLSALNKIPPNRVPIIGAGLVGDYDFNPTIQFCGNYTGTQHVVAALLDGKFTPYFRITHGCTPMDGIYHKITKMQGSFIYELDGKPIVEVIDEFYGNVGWRHQNPVKLLTIGINHGPRFSEPKESVYVNRLIMGSLPNGEGISIFEADLEEGSEIQFMLRDTEEMMKSTRDNSNEIFAQIEAEGKRPVFGLYINCAGRTAEYSNTTSEEAAIVQEVFNKYGIPLLGFYSGVEIAPMLGISRGLDWTGVLTVLAEDEL